MNRLKASILFLLSSIALPISAQLSVGARAGINFAAEPFKNYTHLFLARGYGGVFTNYRLQNPVSFQLELNISGEGSKVKDAGGFVYKDFQTYLNIPLLVQYQLVRGTYFEAGPQLGILLASSSSFSSGSTKADFKSTATGGVIGIGHYWRRAQRGGFGFNIRYMRTLSSINSSAQNSTTLVTGDNLKNRVLSIGITYKWEVMRTK